MAKIKGFVLMAKIKEMIEVSKTHKMKVIEMKDNPKTEMYQEMRSKRSITQTDLYKYKDTK